MEITFEGVEPLIGNTPLIRLKKIEAVFGLKAKIYAKAECFNPSGSVKDRPALYILRSAIKNGELSPEREIIEPTSGNFGISLAMLGAAMGLKTRLVMPDNMSKERVKLMRLYGAKVEFSDGALGMAGAKRLAELFAEKNADCFMPRQFENQNNPLSHYFTTAPEIYSALDGKIDAFVAGVGSGGTITGVGTYLKAKSPTVKIIAVEPELSPGLTEGRFGKHAIQGIGANFIPPILDRSIIDDVIDVADKDAFDYAGLLAKNQGLACGISSGAALYAAVSVAKKPEYEGKTIVCLLPDSADRYYSLID